MQYTSLPYIYVAKGRCRSGNKTITVSYHSSFLLHLWSYEQPSAIKADGQ